MDTGSLNYLWSQTLVAGFAAAGVRHAVISPGSRSTPLALALLRQPAIACRVVIDERCAAFVALGIAKASGVPALVLGTSGSAPGHWLPAVIEADRAAVPLILVSADRPCELQACGANQTVDQSGLFTGLLRDRHLLESPHPDFAAGWLHRLAARAVETSCWPLAGPVQVNQPFREPLLPGNDAVPTLAPLPAMRIHRPIPGAPASETVAAVAATVAGAPGVIVCGAMAGPGGDPAFPSALTDLARKLACPVIAEPLANLRFGPHDRGLVCGHQDRWLRRDDFVATHRPTWVLRFGEFPVNRRLQAYASQAPEVIVVEERPRWNDPAHTVGTLVRSEPAAFCRALAAALPPIARPDWIAAYATAEAEAKAALATLPLPAEARVVQAIVAAVPAGAAVFIGNSLPIRDVDSFSGSSGKAIEFFANRGVSGIDGNLSTAAGIAAVRGPTLALLGDLACQHDLGGLAALRGLPAVVVVINNGGGGIFDHLPQAGLAEFERGWLTPQGIDFAAAAATFGLEYRAVPDLGNFGQVLDAALASGAPVLIEVRVDRAASRAGREAWWTISR